MAEGRRTFHSKGASWFAGVIWSIKQLVEQIISVVERKVGHGLRNVTSLQIGCGIHFFWAFRAVVDRLRDCDRELRCYWLFGG